MASTAPTTETSSGIGDSGVLVVMGGNKAIVLIEVEIVAVGRIGVVIVRGGRRGGQKVLGIGQGRSHAIVMVWL